MLTTINSALTRSVETLKSTLQSVKNLMSAGAGSIYKTLQKLFPYGYQQSSSPPSSDLAHITLNKAIFIEISQEKNDAFTSYNMNFNTLLEVFSDSPAKEKAAEALEVLNNNKQLENLPLIQKEKLMNIIDKQFKALSALVKNESNEKELETLHVLTTLTSLLDEIKSQLTHRDSIDFLSLAWALPPEHHQYIVIKENGLLNLMEIVQNLPPENPQENSLKFFNITLEKIYQEYEKDLSSIGRNAHLNMQMNQIKNTVATKIKNLDEKERKNLITSLVDTSNKLKIIAQNKDTADKIEKAIDVFDRLLNKSLVSKKLGEPAQFPSLANEFRSLEKSFNSLQISEELRAEFRKSSAIASLTNPKLDTLSESQQRSLKALFNSYFEALLNHYTSSENGNILNEHEVLSLLTKLNIVSANLERQLKNSNSINFRLLDRPLPNYTLSNS